MAKDKKEIYITKKEFYKFVEEKFVTRVEFEVLINKMEKDFIGELSHLKIEIQKAKICMLQWGLPFMLAVISLLISLIFRS